MRNSGRKLLALALVVFYGGVSLLGFGLHELSPAHVHCHDHVHADGHGHSHAHHHGHGHSHALCSHQHSPTHASVPQHPGLSDHHDCDICQLLEQIRSDLPQLWLIEGWLPFTSTVADLAPAQFSETPLGLPSPRGPPALSI